MLIINSPMLFTAVWALIKPLLDEATVKKISIIGSSFKKDLLEVIDEQNIPVAYGGSCSCTGGCENSDLGPWNDGSVDGFPQKRYERIAIEFETGQSANFKF